MPAARRPTQPRRGAAFFDLDRTLLSGASGEVFSAAMKTAGLVNRTVPGEKFLFGLFNTIGETLPSMALARQAVTLAKGRSRSSVQEAAASVAPQLVSRVQPFAAALFAEHRLAGRPIVLATTTPYDLVKPFADELGLDDVVATQYGVNADGTYDGTLSGPFVWSAGKLTAIKEWADRHHIDLAESYAYSDSVYDTPMLAAVGHPFVVNPDPRMVLMAAARRWPVLHLDVPPGVAKIPVVGLELQRVAMAFTHPSLFPFAKFDISGFENIPASGAAILCGNHRSYFDPAAIALTIAKTKRTVRFLGKKEVFDAPIVGQIATAMGGIRVARGTGSDEPLKAAAEALAAGDLIALMPQGTIPRGVAFFDPVLKGRWGAAKLAAMTRAPVIPIGLWGTEKVWPRNARIPNVLNVNDAPRVTVRVGEPVDLKYRSVDADTKKIMKAITALLPPEARMHHTPTDEELRATLPSGYKGDPRGGERQTAGNGLSLMAGTPVISLLHGPNLNLLGQREPHIYGTANLEDYVATASKAAAELDLLIDPFQTNHEGELVDAIHAARGRCSAIIINPGAFTHYAWSLHDALSAFGGPIIEVHISNPNAREPWRHTSVISPVATGTILGLGMHGYELAVQAVARLLGP